jgi:ribosomal protein L13
MLPQNRLGDALIKKLVVFSGDANNAAKSATS